MGDIKEGKLLYHLTHKDNLASIMKNGLFSRNDVKKFQCSFEDVADEGILSKRKENSLDNFVLFHFHPYSAFDVAVKNKYGAENFVYITVKRELARRKGFEIIPKHPLSGEFELLTYDAGIKAIEWDIMNMNVKNEEVEWFEKVDVKHVKMAECVSKHKIDKNDFHAIWCNEKIHANLSEKYSNCGVHINKGVWLDGD
ncbi:DarT ssDNA thymidine ADP-ribosyltransferase family protein [Listeria newyorkensis]|uniref:DUF4433 domain-containing protein n=1 Tax=Listeria newyorkensis TaxID=1497681 RepID=A0A841YXN0_9LIST|nr:DarT ssDNA thymidine ADP-ribosyltransferase family protein [Listeria newyorkensis]MBC1458294.1 DUF4433 domain-containing protein [Listeria newyorkensis]